MKRSTMTEAVDCDLGGLDRIPDPPELTETMNALARAISEARKLELAQEKKESIECDEKPEMFFLLP